MNVRVSTRCFGAVLLLIGILGVQSRAEAASPPQTVPYHGTLRTNGVLANGTFDFRFRLYKDTTTPATPTAALWWETQSRVPVANGQFAVQLGAGVQGSTDTFDAAMADRQNGLFLEIAVCPSPATGTCADTGFVTLAGLQAVGSVPYAWGSVPGKVFEADAGAQGLQLDCVDIAYGGESGDAACASSGRFCMGMHCTCNDINSSCWGSAVQQQTCTAANVIEDCSKVLNGCGCGRARCCKVK